MDHHAGLPQSYAAKLALSKKYARENKAFLASLKRKPPRKLDDLFHHLHQQAFEQIDCLQCANCCKTTSPIFYDKDIERLARHLRLRPAQFIEQYLKVDEEGYWYSKSLLAFFYRPTTIVPSTKPVLLPAGSIPTRIEKECTKFLISLSTIPWFVQPFPILLIP